MAATKAILKQSPYNNSLTLVNIPLLQASIVMHLFELFTMTTNSILNDAFFLTIPLPRLGDLFGLVIIFL